VEDLDREVLPHLAEDLLVFLLDDLSGSMVRIDDVVADLEIDALGLAREVEVLDLLGGCLGDGVLLSGCVRVPDHRSRAAVWFRSASSDPRG
jgi:hypothetical protein